MPSSIQYSVYAETALAAYASGLVANQDNTDRYVVIDMMSAVQAQDFASRYTVVEVFSDGLSGAFAGAHHDG